MKDNADETDRGERVWGGDWQARTRSRLHSLGFETVGDFLARYPCESYLKVVKRLGENIAPMQITWMQFWEAQQQGQVREAAKDCLAREITTRLRRGWGQGVRVDYRTSGVYARWVTE